MAISYYNGPVVNGLQDDQLQLPMDANGMPNAMPALGGGVVVMPDGGQLPQGGVGPLGLLPQVQNPQGQQGQEL